MESLPRRHATTRPDLPLATTQEIARASLRNATHAIATLLAGADGVREALAGTAFVAELRPHADAMVRATMRLDGRERLEVEALVRQIGDHVTYLELLSKLARGREEGESTLHLTETTRILDALARAAKDLGDVLLAAVP